MNTTVRQLYRGLGFLAALFGGTAVLSVGQTALTRTAMFAMASVLVLFLAYGENWHASAMRRAFAMRRACRVHGAADPNCCLEQPVQYEAITRP